jgi:hypothetical protein
MTTPTIGEILAEEAVLAEQAENRAGGPYVRSRRRPKDPAQVYSLRVPVDRLDLVRQLAERENTTQAALLRKWVLERLDQELGRQREKDIAPDHARLLALVDEMRAAITEQSGEESRPPRAVRRSVRRKSA